MKSDPEPVVMLGVTETNKVGYRRPPADARFKKGQSGNPKGRPKGSPNVTTVLTKTLRERVVVNENGRRKTITKLEAAVKQLVNKAASGDPRALRYLVKLSRDAEAGQAAQGAEKREIGELDHEVIDSILKRFQNNQEVEKGVPPEAGDDQLR